MRRLIINADDLGLSVAVSRGIEHAHRHGPVTSASLLANYPGFDAGVRVAMENPGLGVGVHLNLIRGEPLCPPDDVAPLLEGGRFLGSFWRIGRVCAIPEYLRAAEREYRAQIERVLDAGLRPDHLDFEKHHGMWGPLYRLGCRLAGEYGLAIRAYHEPLVFIWRHLDFPSARAFWLSLHLHLYQKFAHRFARRFPMVGEPAAPGGEGDNGGFPCPARPGWFFGQAHIGLVDENLLAGLIANCPEGTSELMCHPGFRDFDEERRLAPLVGKTWITGRRDGELRALTARDWRAFASERGVELARYR